MLSGGCCALVMLPTISDRRTRLASLNVALIIFMTSPGRFLRIGLFDSSLDDSSSHLTKRVGECKRFIRGGVASSLALLVFSLVGLKLASTAATLNQHTKGTC